MWRHALCASAVIFTVSSALQKTVSNGFACVSNGRQTANLRNCGSALTNNVNPHRSRSGHAVVAAAPRFQRLRLAAAPDAEPDAAVATDGGVFGAAALVAGNMVGGGILAIPTVCAGPGFYPAAALTICLWAANVGTGLLLGEVAAAAVRRGDEDVSLRALSRDALGESGAQLTSAFFVVTNCVEINQCVGCTRQFFTKSFHGDDAAVLARSSGEELTPPRHRAGVASMAWRSTRRFRTNAS